MLPADTNLAYLLPEITWPGDFDDEEQQEEDADDAGADGSAAAADHSVGGVSTAAAVPEGNCSGNSPVRDPAPPTATEGDCRSPEVLPW